MNAILMRALVEIVTFFGMSSDKVIDPDAAVSQLEAIASMLQELCDSDRQEFILFVEALARSEEAEDRDALRVAFLRSLCESVGLE
jgi:hypothetical protein